MPTSSKLRHGDPVTDIFKRSENKSQGVPTRQFQEFLDEIEESINSIEAEIAKLITTSVETAVDYQHTDIDSIIFATATLEITLIDPALAFKPVTIRNIAGTTTLTPSAGTTEVSSLTVGQGTTLYPRGSIWTEIY